MTLDEFGFSLPYTIDNIWNECTAISNSELIGLSYENIIDKMAKILFYQLKRTNISDSFEFAEKYTRNMIQECKD